MSEDFVYMYVIFKVEDYFSNLSLEIIHISQLFDWRICKFFTIYKKGYRRENITFKVELFLFKFESGICKN